MNKFKVGDRVAVYGGIPGTSEYVAGNKGTVTNSDCDILVRFDKLVGEMGVWSVHPKQCRKLMKKERRRVWIHPDGFKAIPTDGTYQVAATRTDYSCNRWLEFIEVPRKEKP